MLRSEQALRGSCCKCILLTSAQMLVPNTGAQQEGSSLQRAGQRTLENRKHLCDGSEHRKPNFLSWLSLFEFQDLSSQVKGNRHTVFLIRKKTIRPPSAEVKILISLLLLHSVDRIFKNTHTSTKDMHKQEGKGKKHLREKSVEL